MSIKIVAEVLLIIPLGFLILLGLGEIFGGDIWGAQHFVQLLPLFILSIFAWYHPRKGGIVIFTMGTIAFCFYLFMFSHFSLWIRVLNGFLLFGIPILSGVLFIKSSK